MWGRIVYYVYIYVHTYIINVDTCVMLVSGCICTWEDQWPHLAKIVKESPAEDDAVDHSVSTAERR